MSTTIGQTTSRLRNTIKAVKSDAFITDRHLYSMVIKYGSALIKRQGILERILKAGSVFQSIPCMELVEVNRVDACCGPVPKGCTFKRSEDKIPDLMEGEYGPIFRTVSSLDGSIEAYLTTPAIYTKMTKTVSFKYNKNQYYWYLDGYMYFPNLTWDGVMIQALFSGDITPFTCKNDPKKPCVQRQDQISAVPDFLFAEVEQYVLKELGITIQIPGDQTDDKQSTTR